MCKRLVAAMALVMVFAVQLAAQEPGVAQQHAAGDPPATLPIQPVKVVLVKSFTFLRLTGWHELKTEWPQYGIIPITIDDTTLINSDFEYDDLVRSGADVIVLSDPAGGGQLYTPNEIGAVARYAFEGHALLGTYAVFQFDKVDDRGLAPIFGIRADTEFTSDGISNTFKKDDGRKCLFNGIAGRTWQSSGFANSQVPMDLFRWDPKDLFGHVVADSDGHTAIIATYEAANYTAVYISNYPEFFGGTADKQLLYNAVTCFVTR